MRKRVMIDVSPEYAAEFESIRKALGRQLGHCSRVQASNHILKMLRKQRGDMWDFDIKI